MSSVDWSQFSQSSGGSVWNEKRRFVGGDGATLSVFAGVVTLISMGFFQQRSPEQAPAALQFALIVAGITFIVVLVMLALLLLAVDPAQVRKRVDRPVLLPDENPEDPGTDAAASDPRL